MQPHTNVVDQEEPAWLYKAAAQAAVSRHLDSTVDTQALLVMQARLSRGAARILPLQCSLVSGDTCV
jgi:hypothetical protein